MPSAESAGARRYAPRRGHSGAPTRASPCAPPRDSAGHFKFCGWGVTYLETPGGKSPAYYGCSAGWRGCSRVALGDAGARGSPSPGDGAYRLHSALLTGATTSAGSLIPGNPRVWPVPASACPISVWADRRCWYLCRAARASAPRRLDGSAPFGWSKGRCQKSASGGRRPIAAPALGGVHGSVGRPEQLRDRLSVLGEAGNPH